MDYMDSLILDKTVSITFLSVAGVGFEPTSLGTEPNELPLLYPA